MKTITLQLVKGTLLVSALFFSKETDAQLRVGLKAGLNASTIYSPDLGPGLAAKPRVGFQGGLLVDLPLTKSFALQPALLVSTKGYKDDYQLVDNNTGLLISPMTVSIQLVYAEVPILALYRARISPSLQFYGGAGPYVGLGLGGKLSSSNRLFGERDVVFGSGQVGSDSYRRLDYGASAVAGIEVKRLVVGLTYSYGLVDLGSATFKAYHRSLGVSVSFWLTRPHLH